MKKRLLAVLMSGIIGSYASAALVGCAPRDEVLRIYNWGDYIDEDLLGEFEQWYTEQTGRAIEVEYDTFDTNEDMIMRIEVLKSDYDLVCPSDYMAERMINSGLAQKVDKSIFDMTADDFMYDGLAEMIKPFDPDNEYFTPYVWGTFGIMYDTDKIDPESAAAEDMRSWSALWSDKYNKRILMKDSVRDAYSLARIYGNREKLAQLTNGFTDYTGEEYRAEIISYFTEITDASIAEAQNILIAQKPKLYKYEVDDGKNDMLAGTTEAWLGLFWSCDSGLIMMEDGGDHFYYEVPKEGSNVWVDGWIIPKYAANTTAANYFLKFIGLYDDDYDFAMRNFDWMGSSMASKAVMEDAKAALEEDDGTDEESILFEKPEWFKQMYIDMMFPPEEVLARCGVMRDFGKARSTDLDSMWIDVKTA